MATHNKPVSIDGSMFKHSGAWFGLFSRNFPETAFFLGTCRGMAALAPDKNRLIDIFPTFNGEKVAYTIDARPAELTLVTERGNVRFTFADLTKLLAEGDAGMGLRFEKTMVQHESVHPRKDGAWEAFFRMTSAFIFKGLNGSGFNFNDGKTPWVWEKLSSDKIFGATTPAPDGTFTLVLEEFTYGGAVRDSYPDYAEAKAAMQLAWDGFIEALPTFSAPFGDNLDEAVYRLWTFLTAPSGTAKYPMIQMFAGVMASQWQMCQNAVALQEHIDLAVDLMLGPIDRQGPLGQLADIYDDISFESQMLKPPVHGWAVKEIMKNHDLIAETSREKIELLYSGMGKWGDWFMNYRDEDGDGLPSVVHSDETGLDDSTLFREHIQITTPDLAAYLVILFEATGDLAKILGKPESEISAWYKKSTDLLKRLTDELWDGEHFVGLVPGTREKIFSKSVEHYIPAILGKRLPANIINKLADDLTESFLSPWGLASEALDSEYFTSEGFGKGCVIPPVMTFICTGLWETERRDTARLFAERYCKALAADGKFPFFIDAKDGSGLYFGCSWSNCAYVILARLLSE
ncbi:MAG: hypothetical protein LBM98_12715 [Oscillospiraceae bacterium]|jgi:hypothetical protein|nr:hypothetical protein [Oscillospiraceae bacterium]